MLDLTKPKDAHVDQRLRKEPIIWLSTVRPDGRPHLVPVWFFWDGKTILIFSQPGAQKLRNLQHNPNVMLALEAAKEGDDIVLIEGKAELPGRLAQTMNIPEYAKKYDALIKSMNSNPDELAESYSEGIRITPTRFISWDG
jgi:PPOX class probable F420-dependent enzyme